MTLAFRKWMAKHAFESSLGFQKYEDPDETGPEPFFLIQWKFIILIPEEQMMIVAYFTLT